MTEDWRNELFNCCSDPFICCLAFLCKHYTQGKTINMIEGQGCCNPCLVSCCQCCYGEAKNRQKVREHFGIRGTYEEDCGVMYRFTLCGTIQMYKEVLERIGHNQELAQNQTQGIQDQSQGKEHSQPKYESELNPPLPGQYATPGDKYPSQGKGHSQPIDESELNPPLPGQYATPGGQYRPL